MPSLKNRIAAANIYLKLLPFLLLYLLICLLFSQNTLGYDEPRYLMFAKNLTQGYYSPPFPDFNLWNGPGYPLIIAPFVYLDLPLITIRLMNALFLYFSLVLCYKSFNHYASSRISLLFTVILGCYFPVFENIPLILTEVFTWFLISIISLLLIKVYNNDTNKPWLVLGTSIAIAYLAMTKVIFGYVILVLILVSLVLFLIPKTKKKGGRAFTIFFLSYVLCTPWLFYTYSITGELNYWGNSGSMSLYTMSSPHEDDLGDWTHYNQMGEHHQEFIERIYQLTPLEIDRAYRTKAIENIKNHPKKFVKNYLANIGRLFFSYPYSNEKQDIGTYFTIIPNMFIVVLLVLTIPVFALRIKKIPFELLILLLFVFAYLFGSSLVSSYRRMFYINLPIVFLYFSFVFYNLITVRLKPINEIPDY